MNMFEMIESFPNQIKDQYENLLDFQFDLSHYKNISNILIAGMGGSAISGDIISNFLKNNLSIPVIVLRDYSLPKWVDEKSLIILSSYSGNTEETLSIYDQSKLCSSMLISITTGGILKKNSKKDNVVCVPMPLGFQPRAAIGSSLISLVMILQKLTLIDSSFVDLFLNASKELPFFFEDYCKEEQYAYQIAEQINNSMISIYGTQSSTDVISSRFRAQLAENSKIISSHHVLPELDHNEIEGWNEDQFKDMKINIIWLQDEDDHERVKKRVKVTSELLSKIGINNIFISCNGNNSITRHLKLIFLTDMISYYLATINGIDPVPVNRILDLKEKMS